MLTLAGLGSYKKLTKRPTTKYGAFCSKRLEEENKGMLFPSLLIRSFNRRYILGKEKGYMTTMPMLLKAHGPELSAEYHALTHDEKDALLSDYLQTKEEKEATPKKLSNISLGKIVDFRIRHITSTVSSGRCSWSLLTPLQCQELNRMYQTECLVLFSRGNLAHRYGSASYASPGAQRWLECAEIGHSTPNHVAMQLEGFAISGYTGDIKKYQNGVYHIPYPS